MSAGYDPQRPAPDGGAVTPGRPGPVPPRAEPPDEVHDGETSTLKITPSWGAPRSPAAPPAVPAPAARPAADPPTPAGSAPGYPPAGTASGYPPPPGSAPGYPPPGGSMSGYPASRSAPGYPASGPAPGYPPPPGPASGYSTPPGSPQVPPYPAGSVQPYPAGSVPPAGGATPRARVAWPGVLALLLVLGLGGLAGWQAHQIDRLGDRLADTDRRLTEARRGDDIRFDGVEGRTAELERQVGKAFDPEAISTAVLPSVFRVRAGQFTGTAFAVGKPTSAGGTNLFTNFHVVESVWRAGDRRVFLERRDQRFPADIVRVDEDNDVAWLTTKGRFTGLGTARGAVKSGQQIVVIGAPLGLEDTVTTGVVSAFRKEGEGESSGPVIQFDAPINPGNSGGPVINAAKQVVGIATAKARDAEGIGLAVPIKTACDEFKVC